MRFVSILLSLLLSACAIGNRYDYQSVRAAVPADATKSTIAIAAVDLRPDLLSKDVASSYVGMTRGGFGNPFRVATKSGKPLAEDFARSIAGSLDAAGGKARAVSGFPVSDPAAALAALRTSGASHLVLITIKQWESDTLINTELTFDLTVQVYSPTGALLATATSAGTRSLGGSMFPVMHAREQLLSEAAKILSALLETPQIARSLK
jgi:hypothetical protein